jgi:hypothetical protein
MKTALALLLLSFARLESAAAIPAVHFQTRWRVAPSLAFDALCAMNVLSGDPYYLQYYQKEFNEWSPRLTPAARAALADLKTRIKDENQQIISAFLTLYFSATSDTTLDEMLSTVRNSDRMRTALRASPYYSESGWKLYESVRGDLTTILRFYKDAGFDREWKRETAPLLERRIAELEPSLARYNVVPEAEKLLGRPMASDEITVYMLYYSQPHGIKIVGDRFLTAVVMPIEIVVRNAAHELMHPPFLPGRQDRVTRAVAALRSDSFLTEKVRNHERSFGYNTLEGLVEEDCVQALEQIINTRLMIAVEPRKRWKESDDGIHVFAVALYAVMQKRGFDGSAEPFQNFLCREIESGELGAGKIKPLYDAFYASSEPGGARRESGRLAAALARRISPRGGEPRHDGQTLGGNLGAEQPDERLELRRDQAHGDGGRIVANEHLAQEPRHRFRIGGDRDTILDRNGLARICHCSSP